MEVLLHLLHLIPFPPSPRFPSPTFFERASLRVRVRARGAGWRASALDVDACALDSFVDAEPHVRLRFSRLKALENFQE